MRAGRTMRQRWNIVAQSSSVRVTPLLVVSLIVGSGFVATAGERTLRDVPTIPEPSTLLLLLVVAAALTMGSQLALLVTAAASPGRRA